MYDLSLLTNHRSESKKKIKKTGKQEKRQSYAELKKNYLTSK